MFLRFYDEKKRGNLTKALKLVKSAAIISFRKFNVILFIHLPKLGSFHCFYFVLFCLFHIQMVKFVTYLQKSYWKFHCTYSKLRRKISSIFCFQFYLKQYRPVMKSCNNTIVYLVCQGNPATRKNKNAKIRALLLFTLQIKVYCSNKSSSFI